VSEVCYQSSSTTTTTVVFHSTPDDRWYSPAIPGWVQSVHASHGIILVGGVAGCFRCGSIVAARTLKLVKICDGRFKPDNQHRFQTFGMGRLPPKLTQWPDALADPDGVRPVDHLRHTGSEWVWDARVIVAVQTQRGRWQMRGTMFPCRVARPRVSWEPYSV